MFSFSSSCRQLFLSLAIFELFDSQYLLPIDFDEIKDEIDIFFPLNSSLNSFTFQTVDIAFQQSYNDGIEIMRGWWILFLQIF